MNCQTSSFNAALCCVRKLKPSHVNKISYKYGINVLPINKGFTIHVACYIQVALDYLTVVSVV